MYNYFKVCGGCDHSIVDYCRNGIFHSCIVIVYVLGASCSPFSRLDGGHFQWEGECCQASSLCYLTRRFCNQGIVKLLKVGNYNSCPASMTNRGCSCKSLLLISILAHVKRIGIYLSAEMPAQSVMTDNIKFLKRWASFRYHTYVIV